MRLVVLLLLFVVACATLNRSSTLRLVNGMDGTLILLDCGGVAEIRVKGILYGVYVCAGGTIVYQPIAGVPPEQPS